MTSHRKTDTPSERAALLERYANEIYKLMLMAESDGFKVAIVRGLMIDLYDPETDTRTPLPGALELLEN